MAIYTGYLLTGSPPPPPPPPPPPSGGSEPIPAPTPGNVSNLDCWGIGFPCPQTRAVTINLDFSETGSVEVDIYTLIELGKIDDIRCLYIANDTENDIRFDISGIQMKGLFPAQKAGYYPVLATKRDRIVFTAPTDTGLIKLIAANVVMPLQFAEYS